MTMQSHIRAAIEHAQQDKTAESCGLFVIRKGQQIYVPCKNIAADPKYRFAIAPEDWIRADVLGEIVGIAHSHIDASPQPSQADLVACEKLGLPWTIVNPITEEFYSFEPSGYEAPIYGRVYCHGVLDCYSFVRDFYKAEYRLELRDYPREEDWWVKGFDLYRDFMSIEGFYPISAAEMLPGDGIIMNIGSNIGNHGAIYLGDNMIAHHLYKRLSSRDIYGAYYRKNTMLYVRHKDLNQ